MVNIFLDHISPGEIDLVANDYLFRAGDAVNGLYYLNMGCIKLERYTEEGKEVITSFYNSESFIAEASLFNERYHCQAISTESSKVLKFSRKMILKLFEEQPSLAIDYSSILSKEIRTLREQLQFVNILDSEERILSFLRSRSVNNSFQVPGTVKNLAAQIGLTKETLYRKLKVLEEQGFIRRSGKIIELI